VPTPAVTAPARDHSPARGAPGPASAPRPASGARSTPAAAAAAASSAPRPASGARGTPAAAASAPRGTPAAAASAPRGTPAAAAAASAPRPASGARGTPAAAAASGTKKRVGSASPAAGRSTPGDVRFAEAAREASAARRRGEEEAESFAAEEAARVAAEEQQAEAERAAAAAAALAAAAAAAAEAEASKPLESWFSPRRVSWWRSNTAEGTKPVKLCVDTSKAVIATRIPDLKPKSTPLARKGARSSSLAKAAEPIGVVRGDVSARSYGDHKLLPRRSASGEVASAPTRSLFFRLLRLIAYALASLLLALLGSLALEKVEALRPYALNSDLLGAPVCSAAEVGAEAGASACAWTWRSGGSSGGRLDVLLLFRVLLLHTAMAVEWGLNALLPRIPAAYLTLPSDFAARTCGALEGFYFLGLVVAVVTEP
jgi:hypothetical protein